VDPPFLTRLYLSLLSPRQSDTVVWQVEAAVKLYGKRMSEITIFRKSHIRHSELTHRYTRPRGKQPDYTAPVVLRNGKNTVRHFCDAIHKNIVPNFKNGESGFCRLTSRFLCSFLFLSISTTLLLSSCYATNNEMNGS
jgi:hypothetical protein